MRKSRLILMSVNLIMLLMIFPGISDAAISQDSVVALWLFDEADGDILKDSSGNQHNGNIIGAPSWEDGKFGLAINVDGSTYIRIPHAEDLSLETYTITFWLASESAGGWVPVFSKSGGNETRNYALFFVENTGVAAMSVSDGTSWIDVNSGVKANDGNWHYVAMTFDKNSGEATLFFDGEEKAKGTIVMGPFLSEFDIVFAAWHNTAIGNEGYTGKFDDAGIFSDILTQEDIQNIMTTGLKESVGVLAVEPIHKIATTWGKIRAAY